MSTPRIIQTLLYITLIVAIVYAAKEYMSKNQPSTTKSGTVIILNGPSSVGKSSIVKAIQAQQPTPWLSIGIDNFFVGVIPPKFYMEPKPEHFDVMKGIASVDQQGNKLFTLHIGKQGQNIIKGMHHAIAAYARAGNNVIVDYIQYESAWRTDLQNTLQGIPILWIGVTAPLAIIEEREKQRGTSPVGHARSHYDSVHHGMKYDLMLDTSVTTPQQSANAIIELLKNK